MDWIQSYHTDLHDDRWVFPSQGSDSQMFCFACAAQMFNDKDQLLAYKKPILTELLKYLTYHEDIMLPILQYDDVVAGYLIHALIDEIVIQDDAHYKYIAKEVIFQIVIITDSEEIFWYILDEIDQKIAKSCQVGFPLEILNLLGSTLDIFPNLIKSVWTRHKSMISSLIQGLDVNSDRSQSAICDILIHLYSVPDITKHFSIELHEKVIAGVFQILQSDEDLDATVNAAELLKCLADDKTLASLLLEVSCEGHQSFTQVVKKLVLSKHLPLQISAVQSITSAIQNTSQNQYMEQLMQQDLPEFLCEVIITTDEELLSSIFSCLSIFADADQFYAKCHALYVMEPILRSLDQAFRMKNPHTVNLGMGLVAKILRSHPGKTRLFNQDSIVFLCTNALEEGLLHHNQTLFLNSAKASRYLLRKEIMMQPIPFQALSLIIQILGKKLANYPRMQCVPQTCTGPSCSKSWLSQPGSKAWMTEQRIAASLKVILNAARLAEDCNSDPLCDPRSFGKPGVVSDSMMSIEEFIKLIWETFDSQYVPSILGNIKYFSKSKILECFFELLNIKCSLNPASSMDILQRIASTGIISTLLDNAVETRLNQSNIVKSFLIQLCSTLTIQSEESRETLIHAYNLGIADGMKGNFEGMVATLISCDVTQDSLRCIQWTSIALIYIILNYEGPSVMSALEVCHCLQTFATIHLDLLDTLPTDTLKCLTLSIALTNVDPEDIDFDVKALACLAESIKKKGVKLESKNQPSVQERLFQHEALARSFGMIYLLDAIKELVDTSADELDSCDEFLSLKNLLIKNETALMNTLELLSQEINGNDCSVVVTLLKNVIICSKIQETHENNIDALNIIRHYLPNIIQNKLLVNEVRAPDNEMIELIGLQCLSRDTSLDAELCGSDFKIAYHVLKLIPKCLGSNFFGKDVILNYLICLLATSLNDKDNRVPGLLLSSYEFLQMIEEDVNLDISAKSTTLLSLLVLFQLDNNIEVNRQVVVEGSQIFESLRTKHFDDGVPILLLWLSVFKSRMVQSDLLDIRFSESLPDQDADGVVLCNDQIRKLWIDLQQFILKKGYPDCHDLIVLVMQTLLEHYSDVHPTIAKHLMLQPWNRFLLRLLFQKMNNLKDGEEEEDAGEEKIITLPAWLLRLCDILPAEMLRVPEAEIILKHWSGTMNEDKYSCDQYATRLVKKIYSSGVLSLDQNTSTLVKKYLEQQSPYQQKIKWKTIIKSNYVFVGPVYLRG